MIRLSAENINRTSPYKVETIDELSVSFVTNNGVCYDVGFYADTFLSMLDGAYHFYNAGLIMRKDNLIMTKS